jgi:hypothetical protein
VPVSFSLCVPASLARARGCTVCVCARPTPPPPLPHSACLASGVRYIEGPAACRLWRYDGTLLFRDKGIEQLHQAEWRPAPASLWRDRSKLVRARALSSRARRQLAARGSASGWSACCRRASPRLSADRFSRPRAPCAARAQSRAFSFARNLARLLPGALPADSPGLPVFGPDFCPSRGQFTP